MNKYIEDEKYEKEAEKLEVYYMHLEEEIRGYMRDRSPKEVVDYFNRIKKCICGGMPKVISYEGMGEFDIIISCLSCDRYMLRNYYDYDIKEDTDLEELCLQDWNNGLSREDIVKRNEAEWDRKRLREEDLIWKPVYENNVISEYTGPVGEYCLLFQKSEEKIDCCKWTIEYQFEEEEPMMISNDSLIEAYILHRKRYFDVKGPLRIPDPKRYSSEDYSKALKNEDTLSEFSVNDYGDFERAYRTLEEAKKGALARCGWQGFNKDTLLKAE